MSFLRLLKREEGFALLMAMGVLFVLSIAGTTALVYTSINARSGNLSKTNTASFSLAEAAFANAMSILNNPANNALDPDILPSNEATATSMAYGNGTAKWYGVLDRAAERDDAGGEPAGGDRRRLLPQLGPQAIDDAVDLGGEDSLRKCRYTR